MNGDLLVKEARLCVGFYGEIGYWPPGFDKPEPGRR